MYVSGRRGSLDRKRQLYRKFADYYSRSFGSLELMKYGSIGTSRPAYASALFGAGGLSAIRVPCIESVEGGNEALFVCRLDRQ